MFKLNSISKLLKGGEMMKTLILVCALLFVVGGACVADTATIDVYEGWNLITAPLVPFAPNPLDVFAGCPNALSGNLSRWDPTYGGVPYSEDEPETFGNILLGDGYWLMCYSGPTAMQYEGVADGVPEMTLSGRTDMWLSLPGNSVDNSGAWHLLGHPFAHATPVNETDDWTGKNILFTDGQSLLTWSEAVAAVWVSSQMDAWDAGGGGRSIRYDGDGDFDYLSSGQGFWLMTFEPNLAMIILADPEIP